MTRQFIARTEVKARHREAVNGERGRLGRNQPRLAADFCGVEWTNRLVLV
jgi:hypothetical protein